MKITNKFLLIFNKIIYNLLKFKLMIIILMYLKMFNKMKKLHQKFKLILLKKPNNKNKYK